MLRSGEQVFLDDVSVADVERELSVTVTAVGQDGYELLDAICGIEIFNCGAMPPQGDTEYYQYNPGTR
jgi:hypothetical protein